MATKNSKVFHFAKLTYFNGKGRGEVARLLFAANKQEYVNETIEFAEWATVKPKTPQGTLPVLEVNDGKRTIRISQSMSVNRYLARQFDLYGKGNYEHAVVDQVLDTCLDAFVPIFNMLFTLTGDEQTQKLAEYKKDKLPAFLGSIEALIKEGAGKQGYIIGSSLSVADLVLFSYIENCMVEDCLEKFPLIAKNLEATKAQPEIKKYLAARPKMDF